MNRKYYNYKDWEEYKNGMWRKVNVSEEKNYLQKAIQFTGDHILYGTYMQHVIMQWPVSCEQNLLNPDINHRAWIGHAACCIAFQCPEYIVRQAWHYLSKRQQYLANEQADKAYELWVQKFKKQIQLTMFEAT